MKNSESAQQASNKVKTYMIAVRGRQEPNTIIRSATGIRCASQETHAEKAATGSGIMAAYLATQRDRKSLALTADNNIASPTGNKSIPPAANDTIVTREIMQHTHISWLKVKPARVRIGHLNDHFCGGAPQHRDRQTITKPGHDHAAWLAYRGG
jgi:hypothetical protein